MDTTILYDEFAREDVNIGAVIFDKTTLIEP
jgi:hypothetical protein